MQTFIVAVAGLVLAGSQAAFAGVAIPAPLAGLAGPYGLVALALTYGGFRIVKHLRQSR